ncbi:MAG TPA: NAD(P)-dependent oxidoreductase [Phototrophicaceae bacterium]|jgi:nucleoside-diphosphate-sugar epimerase|nr:NAD(P)-dependent oxidoreductase [Phototrophicaceae bacterium]
MRVLITGGTGLIGKAVTARLLQNGWQVRIFDLPETFDNPLANDVEYVQGDILNFDHLLQHTIGCDVIVHMAAIRSPHLAPGHDVFQINVAGTFNVFEAAARAGIRRIVQASSINALGLFYSLGDMNLRYFPIDEDHPGTTSDPYSFSKQMIEDIGAYYWRRSGISSVALRFPAVFPVGFADGEQYQQRRNSTRQLMDELMGIPEVERRTRIADAHRRVLEFRQRHPFEFRPDEHGKPSNINIGAEDPLFRSYNVDRFNLWAFVDERDAAQSIEKGLTATYQGSHPMYINAAVNTLGYDTRTLLSLFFPLVSPDHFKTDLPGACSVVSIERARTLIDFSPEYPPDVS